MFLSCDLLYCSYYFFLQFITIWISIIYFSFFIEYRCRHLIFLHPMFCFMSQNRCRKQYDIIIGQHYLIGTPAYFIA